MSAENIITVFQLIMINLLLDLLLITVAKVTSCPTSTFSTLFIGVSINVDFNLTGTLSKLRLCSSGEKTRTIRRSGYTNLSGGIIKNKLFNKLFNWDFYQICKRTMNMFNIISNKSNYSDNYRFNYNNNCDCENGRKNTKSSSWILSNNHTCLTNMISSKL